MDQSEAWLKQPGCLGTMLQRRSQPGSVVTSSQGSEEQPLVRQNHKEGLKMLQGQENPAFQISSFGHSSLSRAAYQLT